MRDRSNVRRGLGAKLNLSLLAFMLLLTIATAAFVYAGFRRTQDHASASARDGLESEGRTRLLEMAGTQAFIGQLQISAAAELGQEAAHFIYAARGTTADGGGTAAWDPGILRRRASGHWWDPRPGRLTDVLTFPSPTLTPEMERDLRDSAVLDALLPSLVDRPSELPEHANFAAIAIYYIGPSGSLRYYPPAAVGDEVPEATLEQITALLTRVGPAENPLHRAQWTGIYADELGQGDVLTAYIPVYDGTRYRGVIGIDLSADRLSEQVASVDLLDTGYAFYVGRDGVLLNTPGHDRIQAALDDPSNVAFAQAYQSMLAGLQGVDRVTIDGRDVYVAYAPMGDVGGALALVAPIDELTALSADITASINREGNRTLLAVMLTMLALFVAALGGAAWLNRRVLLQPIAALVAGTQAVAAGELDATIPVGSRDELGALGDAFNAMTAQLRETEGRYKRIFDTTRDGLVIARVDGTIVEANPAACAMHGYNYEEFLALPPGEHIAERDRERRRDLLGTVAESGPYRVRGRDVRKDGSTFDVEALGTGFTYRGEPHTLVVIRDISEQVRAEQLLEQRVDERTRELQVLLGIAQSVASTLDMRELAGRILDQLATMIDYTGAGILLREGDDLAVLEARGPHAASEPDLVGRRFPLPTVGFMRGALATGTPRIVNDVAADAAMAAQQRAEVPGPAGEARAWLAVPLVIQDRVLGLLTLWSSEAGRYDAEHADLAMAVASQAAVAIENARLFEQASAVAAIEERQRLARELHDSVSQALYGIALGAQTARALLDDDPARAVEPVDYVLSLAEAGLAEMRALIFELRPESLAAEGIVPALEKQVAAIRARYGIAVTAELPEEPDVPLRVKEAIYRIAQEAMHNTIKHARATHIDVRLAVEHGAVELDVRDDGAGFDPGGDFPGHLGLQSMRERAAAAGGTVTIESRPGDGTTVHLRFDA